MATPDSCFTKAALIHLPCKEDLGWEFYGLGLKLAGTSGLEPIWQGSCFRVLVLGFLLYRPEGCHFRIPLWASALGFFL